METQFEMKLKSNSNMHRLNSNITNADAVKNAVEVELEHASIEIVDEIDIKNGDTVKNAVEIELEHPSVEIADEVDNISS